MPYSTYEQQQVQVQRRRAIADMLMKQAQNAGDDRMQVAPGGAVVPYSLGEAFSKLGQGAIAHKADLRAKAEEDKARAEHDASLTEAISQYRNVGDASGYTGPMHATPGQMASRQSDATEHLLDEAAPKSAIAQLMLQRAMKPEEEYTLSQGQQRMRGTRVLGSVPAKPEPDSVDWVGTGGKKEPRSHRTGLPVPGMSPIAMEQTPEQARGAFTERHSGLLAAMAARGVTLPSGLRSKEQMRSTLDGLVNKYPDLNDDQIADNIANGKIGFGAQSKAALVAGAQAGKVQLGLNEIQEFAPIVLDASSKVDRGTFMPVNKLMQAGDAQLSDPNLRDLKIGITSLLNAYDQVAARGGTDMNKRAEAHALLMSADSPEVLQHAVAMFQREAEAAERAAQQAMRPGNTKAPAALPQGVTEDDITETMRANKMTRDQVLQKLNAR